MMKQCRTTCWNYSLCNVQAICASVFPLNNYTLKPIWRLHVIFPCSELHVRGKAFFLGRKEKKDGCSLLICKHLQWILYHHTPKPSKFFLSQQSHPNLISQPLECYESFPKVASKTCFANLFWLFSIQHLHSTNYECNPKCLQRKKRPNSSKTSKSHQMFCDASAYIPQRI